MTTTQARELLLKARNELLRIKRDLTIHHTSDEVERMEQMVSRDVETRLASSEAAKIKAIDAALKRIDRGEYGICLVCDEHIPEKRLKAVPWASTCIPCQQQAELQTETSRTKRLEDNDYDS